MVRNQPSPPVPSSLVKFSERRYAIPHADSIQLCTPAYYRDYHRNGIEDSIQDEEEARYSVCMDLQDFIGPYGHTQPIPSLSRGLGTALMTYGTKDCLVFCTSALPSNSRSLRRIGRRVSENYDSATRINEPSVFAEQLGKAVGAHLREGDVFSTVSDTLARLISSFEIGRNLILVYHGWVAYVDDPASIITAYPEGLHGMVAPFVKRRQFAHQKEYRFVVWPGGQPKDQSLLVPIPDDLRALTNVVRNRIVET